MDLEDLRAVTATATEPQVLSAYRAGLFPMGIGRGGTGRMGWWAPRRRGVLLPGDLRVSKSLRKSMRAFDFTVDTAFDDVIRACADPSRAGAWITREILDLYTSLHAHGWAHSVEVWKDGRLAGGLYGVAIGSLFAGESMFHRETDASKAALAHLVGLLDDHSDGVTSADEGEWLIDTQWQTPHLATLGVSEISGLTYAARLESALRGNRAQLILNK
ncbi:leucyl/phenylalanyl-tRNA--protein transferase [Brevibacterium metallidurans]|uniref:Leucyl/phenylalanyl-tRNA--protein transferase n=1 Tax=Brevibacterium metallidurans TaxID=1482676 RepID=A0ABP3C4Y5_9MICO